MVRDIQIKKTINFKNRPIHVHDVIRRLRRPAMEEYKSKYGSDYEIDTKTNWIPSITTGYPGYGNEGYDGLHKDLKDILSTEAYKSWYDSIDVTNFTQISTASELVGLMYSSKDEEALSKNYVITNNINMSSYPCRPIGSKLNPFTGTLCMSGNFKISNMTINIDLNNYKDYTDDENNTTACGLVSYLGAGGRIINVHLGDNNTIKISNSKPEFLNCGFLCGMSSGFISGCTIGNYNKIYVKGGRKWESPPHEKSDWEYIGTDIRVGFICGQIFQNVDNSTGILINCSVGNYNKLVSISSANIYSGIICGYLSGSRSDWGTPQIGGVTIASGRIVAQYLASMTDSNVGNNNIIFTEQFVNEKEEFQKYVKNYGTSEVYSGIICGRSFFSLISRCNCGDNNVLINKSVTSNSIGIICGVNEGGKISECSVGNNNYIQDKSEHARVGIICGSYNYDEEDKDENKLKVKFVNYLVDDTSISKCHIGHGNTIIIEQNTNHFLEGLKRDNAIYSGFVCGTLQIFPDDNDPHFPSYDYKAGADVIYDNRVGKNNTIYAKSTHYLHFDFYYNTYQFGSYTYERYDETKSWYQDSEHYTKRRDYWIDVAKNFNNGNQLYITKPNGRYYDKSAKQTFKTFHTRLYNGELTTSDQDDFNIPTITKYDIKFNNDVDIELGDGTNVTEDDDFTNTKTQEKFNEDAQTTPDDEHKSSMIVVSDETNQQMGTQALVTLESTGQKLYMNKDKDSNTLDTSNFTIIDTEDKLVHLMKKTNPPTGYTKPFDQWDGNYVITANLDMAGKKCNPIGNKAIPFTGTLCMSNDVTISNMKMTVESGYAGLVGYLGHGGRIINVNFGNNNTVISKNNKQNENNGETYSGIICGYNEGIISGCTVGEDNTVVSNGKDNVCSGIICGYNKYPKEDEEGEEVEEEEGEEEDVEHGDYGFIFNCTVNDNNIVISNGNDNINSGVICGYNFGFINKCNIGSYNNIHSKGRDNIYSGIICGFRNEIDDPIYKIDSYNHDISSENSVISEGNNNVYSSIISGHSNEDGGDEEAEEAEYKERFVGTDDKTSSDVYNIENIQPNNIIISIAPSKATRGNINNGVSKLNQIFSILEPNDSYLGEYQNQNVMFYKVKIIIESNYSITYDGDPSNLYKIIDGNNIIEIPVKIFYNFTDTGIKVEDGYTLGRHILELINGSNYIAAVDSFNFNKSTQLDNNDNNDNKNNTTMWIVISIVIALLLIGGGVGIFFYVKKKKQ